MKCVITYTKSTEGEDFYGEGADAKVPELGSRKVCQESIFAIKLCWSTRRSQSLSVLYGRIAKQIVSDAGQTQ